MWLWALSLLVQRIDHEKSSIGTIMLSSMKGPPGTKSSCNRVGDKKLE